MGEIVSYVAVPQQAPPGTKPAVAPSPPVKKTLPLVSQPSPKPVIAKPAPPRPVSPPQPPPPPPEVCLRWNSYHSNMQATFPSLLNNEQFVDVTLACEGRSIKCHKVSTPHSTSTCLGDQIHASVLFYEPNPCINSAVGTKHSYSA